MKQPPIKTKELSGSTVQIADGQNWEIASITAYGENAQGGTTETPVALTGVDSVFVGGRNLLPKATKTQTIYGVTFTPNPDGSVSVSGTCAGGIATYNYADNLIPISPNQVVCLSGASQLVKVVINEKTPSGAFVRNVLVDRGQGISGTLTKQKEENILYATLQVQIGDAPNLTIHPMLNLGNAAMPYEPYRGSVTTLPIPRPLHEVSDVRDICVTRVKSVWDKSVQVDINQLKKTPVSPYQYYINVESNSVNTEVKPAASTLSYSKTTGVDPFKNGINFWMNGLLKVDDLEHAKAWFTEHPTKVFYQSTSYNGTNGLDVCLTEYQTGFVELDGTEDWKAGQPTEGGEVYFTLNSLQSNSGKLIGFSSHFPVITILANNTNQGVGAWNTALYLRWKALFTDVDSLKAYLAAQKAAGTPVQIAYQLAAPEVYATDPLDIDNAAGPLTVMTGGEVEVTLTHRMLTPYTAWTIQYDSEGEYTGDFFNVEDYDRIKQNIEYLREYAYFLYGGFTLRGMVAVTVESYGYASTIDALDANLEAIAANTFRPPDMLPVKQWRGNQPPPGADDWNRIENTCLLLFEQFERQFACLPKLAFELKGSAF